MIKIYNINQLFLRIFLGRRLKFFSIIWSRTTCNLGICFSIELTERRFLCYSSISIYLSNLKNV